MLLRTRQALNLLVYSNLFIACCAVAQTTLTYRLLDLAYRLDILVLVGASTMVFYSTPQVLHGRAAPTTAKLRWSQQNRPLFLTLVAVATALSITMLLQLQIPGIMGCALVGIVAMAYYTPLLRRKGRREGLRGLYGAKVFYIALVWGLVCVGLPALVAYATGLLVEEAALVQQSACVFVFVLAITIPFDIRDQQSDRRYGLRTLPVLVGTKRSCYLGVVLLVLHMALVMASEYGFYIRLPLIVVSALALLLLATAKAEKPDYFYFLALDGLLILQWLAVEAGTSLAA